MPSYEAKRKYCLIRLLKKYCLIKSGYKINKKRCLIEPDSGKLKKNNALLSPVSK